jgi:carbon monoxide dehydrogenase subunit G
MKLEHEFRVPVPITQAWDVLLDVERIAPCMPGATVESFDGETVTGRVKVKVGPIQVTYNGTTKFIEKNEAGRRVTLDASGKEARGSGTAKATIVAVLQDEGEQTLVNVTTNLAITGKPAQFGRGVMVEVGNKLLGRFADCLAEEIGIGSSGDSAAPASPDATSDAPADKPGAVAKKPAAAADAPADKPAAVADVLGAAAGGGAVAGVDDGAGAGAAGGDGDAVGAVGAVAVGGGTKAGMPGGRNGTSPSPQVRPLASATASRPSYRPAENEAIDLLDVGGPAILKRVAPLAIGLVALVILWRLLHRR